MFYIKTYLFALWMVMVSMNAFSNTDYPKIELDNKVIQVSIYLPDANRGYYRGTRFDWSGIIEKVAYASHLFYAPLHQEHNPLGHDHVSGPAEEFAMFNPMGFTEAKPGESFVKIGVGLLAKNESSDYQFNGAYALVRVGQWDINHGADWVSFEQELIGDRGWAYRYRKTIRLLSDRPELVIEHSLTNIGSKTIDINNYNHNFTIIDNVPYGPNYKVEFPFTSPQPMSINNKAWFRGNAIEVEKPLGGNSLWVEVFKGEDPGGYNAARVRNNKTGAAVEFTGDAPITRMVFWAVERAASPEPFIHIYLEPAQNMTWSSHYRFMVDGEG